MIALDRNAFERRCVTRVLTMVVSESQSENKTNMKKTILILTAVASLTIAARAGEGEIGRYQLIAADVDNSGHQTVFKIDTATGQAWRYTKDPNPQPVDIEHPPKDYFDAGWAPIRP